MFAFGRVPAVLVVGAVTPWFATSFPSDAATLGLAVTSGVVYCALAYVCCVAALRQCPLPLQHPSSR